VTIYTVYTHTFSRTLALNIFYYVTFLLFLYYRANHFLCMTDTIWNLSEMANYLQYVQCTGTQYIRLHVMRRSYFFSLGHYVQHKIN
jgi:hypothetical protein